MIAHEYTYAHINLDLEHSISMDVDVVQFGHPEALRNYTSCKLQALPTVAELAAIGELLLGGADWQSVNDVLTSLARQKTGKA
jgi:hypothetical protein